MESLRKELIALIEQQAIPPEKIKQAVSLANITPTPNAWLVFINALLLWVASIALALSCIFFIAHNWSGIGNFAKFLLVEIALICAIVAYLKLKPYQVASNAALIVATLLLGALMALFGQTYQTGADPWQLFFNWALLITPWVLIARFTSLWIIWLVLLNLSIVLYLDVNPNPLNIMLSHESSLLWLLFSFNSCTFICWHWLSQSHPWMQKVWAIRLIALAAGSSITALALSAAFDKVLLSSLALPIWALFLGALYWRYRQITIDLFMLSGACLSAMLVLTSWCAAYISAWGDEGLFLLLATLIIGLGATSAMWLKKIQTELH